ncbi:MAG: C10 family peptidase, partial [Muribaculaceae bacterium]|nr:C10 family peptidase [Muribaculaceae bacterium]
MKKNLTLILAGLIGSAACFATPLTPQQALDRASANGSKRIKSKSMTNLTPVYTAESESGVRGAYIFNIPEGGFLILSADDLCYPVLGYSNEGAIDVNNLPVQLKSWLRGYCDQLEYVIDEGLDASVTAYKMTTRSDNPSIAPMLKTKWDQGAPYNDSCPEINGRHTYTGCVATSMAQVMNYFKYPEVGTGRVTVNVNGVNSSMTLSDYPFDWANMSDYYIAGKYTDAQAAAVATLMKACGYSVGMSYGLSASGAQSAKISVALKKYFNYDSGITYQSRIGYSASEWQQKIYASLAGGSPVIYGGQDPAEGGHSFVCDGYDKDGYFHFNWGWGGMADGYFTLNALNPEALGTGGGSGGGFNFMQHAVLNIKKPTGGTTESGLAMLTAAGGLKVDNVSGSTIQLGLQGYYDPCWMNESDSQLNLALGGVFTQEGSTEVVAVGTATLAGKTNCTLGSGTYYPYVSSSGSYIRVSVNVPSSLPNGTYKMTLSGREANHPTWAYEPVITPYGYPNYVMVTKNGSKIEAQTIPVPKVEMTTAAIEGPLYYKRNVTIKATLVNISDFVLTCSPMIVLK